MRPFKIKFKYVLRQRKQNEDDIMATEHAKSLMNKHINSFWSGIQKSHNSSLTLATIVNQYTGESNIAEIWQDHYTAILNNVQNSKYWKNVNEQIGQISTDSIKLLIN